MQYPENVKTFLKPEMRKLNHTVIVYFPNLGKAVIVKDSHERKVDSSKTRTFF